VAHAWRVAQRGAAGAYVASTWSAVGQQGEREHETMLHGSWSTSQNIGEADGRTDESIAMRGHERESRFPCWRTRDADQCIARGRDACTHSTRSPR
jgi:hypothetical protein